MRAPFLVGLPAYLLRFLNESPALLWLALLVVFDATNHPLERWASWQSIRGWWRFSERLAARRCVFRRLRYTDSD
jgi:hypothetical protein